MKCNVGGADRVVRAVVGLVGLALAVPGSPIFVSQWFYILAAVGLVTALVRYCPLSHMLGINTCAVKEPKGPAAGEQKMEAGSPEQMGGSQQ